MARAKGSGGAPRRAGARQPKAKAKPKQQVPAVLKLLYTVDEAAAALGVSRSRLYKLVMSEQIVSIRIGCLRRIPVAALEQFVQAQTRQSA